MSANEAGYGPQEGPGTGDCSTTGCSGAGYASRGGHGHSVNSRGISHVPYDSILRPGIFGSGGGGKVVRLL